MSNALSSQTWQKKMLLFITQYDSSQFYCGSISKQLIWKNLHKWIIFPLVYIKLVYWFKLNTNITQFKPIASYSFVNTSNYLPICINVKIWHVMMMGKNYRILIRQCQTGNFRFMSWMCFHILLCMNNK